MGARARSVALWCAVAVAVCAGARGFTIDCNQDYADCETELSKLEGGLEEDLFSPTSNDRVFVPDSHPHFLPTIPPETLVKNTPKVKDEKETKNNTEAPKNVEDKTEIPKQSRLLNHIDENLQNFANALHNQTTTKIDLSDVNMEDEEELNPIINSHDHSKHEKAIPNQFYSNLQSPFNPLMDPTSNEHEHSTCKENGVTYKIGDKIERGCDETCECQPGGNFECVPRCRHPYIRKGRKLSDPLCFESPVDECCSIIACATGNQDVKSKVEVCLYNNQTHVVGDEWYVGCEKTCFCEPNSVVNCRSRCKKIIPSEKCINVQDPQDECCEVQICDVSQDVHEEPENVTSSTTSTTTTTTVKNILEGAQQSLFDHKSPLDKNKSESTELLTENPIGSVKVLQNNSVQVNLISMNSSESPIYLQLSSDGGKHFEDVELKNTNLILNLPGGKNYILKSKDSGQKFNFTITAAAMDTENGTVQTEKAKGGCYQDGVFYAVGEEFHIGCSQLCECTGPDSRECVDLICPSHVGLELVSKGCVRWAPSPPAEPPNCCPRAARCLSTGTCHYKGVEVPNWSEVPISLTGCEQRCFCENGDLDCQEVCTPLPPVPPQSLRCPPHHHPAPLNISDEDCCKQWGCLPNADVNTMTQQSLSKSTDPTALFFNTFFKLQQTSTAPSTTTEHVIPTEIYAADETYITDETYVADNTYVTDKTYVTDETYVTDDIIYSPDSINYETPHSSILDIAKPKPHTSTEGSIQSYRVSKEKIYHIKDKSENNNRLIFEDFDQQHIKTVQCEPKLEQPTYSPKLINSTGSRGVHSNQQNPRLSTRPITGMTYFVPSSAMPYFEDDNHNEYNAIHAFSPHYMFIPSIQKNRNHFNANYKNKMSILTNTRKVISPVKYNAMQSTEVLRKYALPKSSNRYEAVILKPVKPGRFLEADHKVPVYTSPIGFDQLINQMELESEVNKNLGRSADKHKKEKFGAGNQPPAPATTTSHTPIGHSPFLPTVPPMIHFPTEELPDYDQNNLHHPHNTREPPLPGLPPGLNLPPGYGEENKKLSVLSVQADSPTSVKLLFGLPPVLVGLRGSVDLRYTDQADEDISHWYSQVFAPADEVLTTPRLEFRLTGLKPSTTYKIKGKLFLHNLPVEPESPVYTVRTLDLPTVMPPIEEKRREVDSRLVLVDANDTAAHVSWRHFSEDELQFIDGIQVRYRPVGTPIYSMTELLHHSRTIAELHDLRPGTKYEASLVLIPPPRATTELHDPGTIQFTTSPFVDPYNWTVTIEAHVVGSDAAELTWHGVPSPAERWVRVYRAAHACGSTRHEHDAFRLAARDLPPTIMLSGLEANTRCRVWMELFLTNGKIKTSNVLEINTRPADQPEEIDNEIEASGIAGSAVSAGARGGGRGDYYGALVVVGVVAALGAVTSLLLLLVLVRRHRPRSVPITPVPSAPRESSLPPYDNPAYKLELQQETMDL